MKCICVWQCSGHVLLARVPFFILSAQTVFSYFLSKRVNFSYIIGGSVCACDCIRGTEAHSSRTVGEAFAKFQSESKDPSSYAGSLYPRTKCMTVFWCIIARGDTACTYMEFRKGKPRYPTQTICCVIKFLLSPCFAVRFLLYFFNFFTLTSIQSTIFLCYIEFSNHPCHLFAFAVTP